MLSPPNTGDWQPTRKSASPLLWVCQRTRQHCGLRHPNKQLITVIKAELNVLLLCASSPFMWTNKLEEQHMDGDQKLNMMSPCFYQQGQGVTHSWCLHLHPGHLYCKPHDAKVRWNLVPTAVLQAAWGLLVSTDLPYVAQDKQAP